MKNIKCGENKLNERAQTFSYTPSVTIQGYITAMRYRNDVIRLVLLLHIRASYDVGTGLRIMSGG